ncbi:hypothetical protein F5Y01DRAFT_321665 [Xylaria sp. FL0043]|nr:hypothetical protein F5Y01DRAFT_321665 [Xylaria sp. FL0043]
MDRPLTTRIPHHTNNNEFRPTPELSRAQTPGSFTLQGFERRFPNLSLLGSFRVWPLEDLYPGIIIEAPIFNCFAWSVGHTDRWVEGGTVEDMNDFYEYYYFEQCHSAEADVELYRMLHVPATFTSRHGEELVNPMAIVRHAHRRDHPELDAPPNLGCSSKLRDGPLIAHNRMALVDTRSSSSITIWYGTIYQYWRRTSEHPSFPGKRHNLRPPDHNPQNSMFGSGWGEHPPGHPGNSRGLPGYDHSVYQGAKTSNTSRNSSAVYARVSRMEAYDPIPPPSRAGQESATWVYKGILESCPNLVKEFQARFYAWQTTWHDPTKITGPNARDRCDVPEFDGLLAMGPRILPLVVYKLLNPWNFTAVFLYNALERNTRYLVDPRDVSNFLVLQRQNNLIIDINQGRNWSL